MKKVFFISDTHFGLEENKSEIIKQHKFHSFCEKVKEEGSELFLLGDIFDYWIAHNHNQVIPKEHIPIIHDLIAVKNHGITITYIAGNHEFGFYSYFEKALKIKVLTNPIHIRLFEENFFLLHGHELNLSFMNKMLNSPTCQFLYSLLPASFAIGLMKFSSRILCKMENKNKTLKKINALKKHAEEISQLHHVKYFICGHLHHKEILSLQNGYGYYVNLGTWVDGAYCFGEYDGVSFYSRDMGSLSK